MQNESCNVYQEPTGTFLCWNSFCLNVNFTYIFSLVSKANFGYSGNLMYILQTNEGMNEQQDK